MVPPLQTAAPWQTNVADERWTLLLPDAATQVRFVQSFAAAGSLHASPHDRHKPRSNDEGDITGRHGYQRDDTSTARRAEQDGST